MLKIIRGLLQNIIDNIDSGNSNLSEDECMEAIECLKSLSDKTQYISKYEAYTRIGVSRATFDRMVQDGILPKGIKKSGFTEKFWILKDIEEYILKTSQVKS